MMTRPWTPVKSSNLDELALQGSTLKVRFKGGAEYHYYGVPETVFDEVVAAESVGRTFNSSVKNGGYRFEKVGQCQREQS